MERARARDRERDRLLASRFNAFDYLRRDELGLSKVIRDLLDPGGTHGQGARFLTKFADLVGPDRWPMGQSVRYDEFNVKVQRERATDGGGRLDISVEFRPRDQEAACIAFENKPYAADGKDQISDYLAFLRRHYGRRFLLVYLSGHGGMPSEFGLPRDADKDGLATMSFCPRPSDDEDGDNLRLCLPFSLSEWLQECRQICEAGRLRWFLGEVEKFCHKEFGGTVTTTSEHKEVSDFILASDGNLFAALAVVEVWPKVLESVVGRFLEVLRQRIGAELGSFENLVTKSDFRRNPKNGVWAFRRTWYGKAAAVPIVSLSHERDAKDWFLGVSLDSGTGEAADSLRECLRKRLSMQSELRGSYATNWPWYRFLEDDYRDWQRLLVQLHRESQEPGDLTAWFGEQFVETAKLTIPIIDEVLEIAE